MQFTAVNHLNAESLSLEQIESLVRQAGMTPCETGNEPRLWLLANRALKIAQSLSGAVQRQSIEIAQLQQNKATEQVQKPTGDQFYFIWNPVSVMPPRVKFDDFDRANDAAQRLADKVPGNEFFIAKAVAVAKTVKTKTTFL